MATLAPDNSSGPSEPAERSERIGAYEILSTLGQGGMARTYVAMRHGPGGFAQRVCLKRILREHDQDPEFVRQFLAEARIAASVSHANLVKVLDFGSDNEGYYLALELVQGMDLSGVLSGVAARGERLGAELVAYIAIELAAAIEVLHRASPDGQHQGLVHRDVSPSNVLISYDGEVKLADFGIARAVDGPKHTRTGIIKGKVPYMAPSYARTARADARCDLFAVGVVLFELLAGRRPYQGPTDLITLELAAKGEHAPLASLAPNAPAQLVEAVERLIDPDPVLTFQSASELLSELSTLPLSAATLRRELGQLVESLKPRRASSPPPRPGAIEANAVGGETTTQPAPTEMPLAGPADATRRNANVDRGASPAAPSQRGRFGIVIAAAVIAVGTIVAAIVVTRAPTNVAQPVSPPVAPIERDVAAPAPTAAPTGPSIVRGTAEPSLVAADEIVASAAPIKRKATLTVVVFPYGDVILDGKERGRAPVTAKLNAGSHEVTVVRQGTHTTQRIELREGETRRIEVK